MVCTPGTEIKEETSAEKGRRADEAGVTRKEDERRSQQPEKSQNASGDWTQTESAPEVSTVPTAAQEAHR
ncbi:hypothetical protein NDU88_007068 [Pleurodeles waltl]|uniref:Uncharacterized protein n=1 Tax=Pleurodeles waltl TaxID=8319 RepID=A0AAV7RS32_PLEWA|nr:hypothetical protein NDU88_007068 [Pleurodeles waltl]